ncbi:MAG: metalloregulator ArsR/SmtB family transcription factor [Balneolaceae bacterium]|nr:metalloregulator ArsR/SmtB family transcription factor [Balneolaceae bacterium]
MAHTKASLFKEKHVKAAELAKAISHPARLAILEILSKRESCICGDITSELPLAQSTVSQHLKVLKTAGLIKGEVEGPRTCYCIHPETMRELKELMDQWFEEFTPDQANCC